jgi:epoxyqueuosine reductase
MDTNTADAGPVSAELKRLALELGFARVGIARAEALSEDAKRLSAWLAAGHHGQMAYMEENVDVRSDPRHDGMLPSACSVVVLATAYARSPGLQGPEPGRMARYAQGRDYHALLYDRTRVLRRYLRDHGAAVRASVDTLPVLERAWAARAGVGFVGKNACIIVPGLGSHVLLSTLVTSAELEPDEPLRERCGDCRLCLDACPTRAFLGPKQLDARRCISYLTIEHEGSIDESLRADMGPWLFGCDACQDVCPFNRRGQLQEPGLDPFAPRGRLMGLGAEDFLRMDEACFDRYSRGSAMRRAGRDSMARNAAIVLGNSRERRYLPVLSHAAERDRSEVVREAARWALTRLAGEPDPRRD